MEDEVVSRRCAAVVEQLLHSGPSGRGGGPSGRGSGPSGRGGGGSGSGSGPSGRGSGGGSGSGSGAGSGGSGGPSGSGPSGSGPSGSGPSGRGSGPSGRGSGPSGGSGGGGSGGGGGLRGGFAAPLSAAADALRQRAMLLYRLCRARREPLAADQTHDAALCVLSAVAATQPALWSVLTRWSRALRPRQPELRFTAATLRLREVEQFIARTAHLMKQKEEKKGEDKEGKEEKAGEASGVLDEPVATQLALAYFHSSVTNVKRFRAVVAALAQETGRSDAVRAILSDTGRASEQILNRRSTHRENRPSYHPSAENEEDVAAAADEDGDADDNDHYNIMNSSESLVSHTPLLRFYNTGPTNWTALADAIDDARRENYLAQLQRCMRDPLLYSPAAGVERTRARCGVTHDAISDAKMKKMKVEDNTKGQQEEMEWNGTEEIASSVGVRYFHHCCDTSGLGCVSAPAHFLHPSRSRPQSLVPLPAQWITAQQLWSRLLVAALWLSVPQGKRNKAADQFCRTVVQAARKYESSAHCVVCDELVRARPTLHIAALQQNCEEESMETDNTQLRAWDDMKRAAVASEAPTASNVTCRDVLRCLSVQLAEKAQALSRCHKTEAEKPRRLEALVTATRGSFPVDVCGAAITGGVRGESALCFLLRGENAEGVAIREGNESGGKRKRGRGEEPQAENCDALFNSHTEEEEEKEEDGAQKNSLCGDTEITVNKLIHEDEEDEDDTMDVQELLNFVPCIPRLREEDGVLECAGCLLLFHQECVCPVQRELTFGHFLCHSCRLHADPPLPLLINRL